VKIIIETGAPMTVKIKEILLTEYPTAYPTFVWSAAMKDSKAPMPKVKIPLITTTDRGQKVIWKLYQFEASLGWIGLYSPAGEQMITACNGVYSLIPKVELFPDLESNKPGTLLEIFQELIIPFNDESFMDATDPDDIVINFRTPDCVKENPGKYEIGYHGTSIKNVESIVINGLAKPQTLTSVGVCIKIPLDHIQRNTDPTKLPESIRHIQNFEQALFLSPCIQYSGLPIYARAFGMEGKEDTVHPILECYVERDKIQKIEATTKGFKIPPNSGFVNEELEWRVVDPSSVHVKCLHILSANRVFLF